MNEQRSRTRIPRRTQYGRAQASWILGSVFGLFLLGVYVFQGNEVTTVQHKLLGLFGAFTAAAFSFFFSGEIGLKLNTSVKGWVGISLKATGSIAVFVFVLYWWSGPFAPITTNIINVRQEVRHFISELNQEFKKFEIKLNDQVAERLGDISAIIAQKQSLLIASEAAKAKLENFLHNQKLNRHEKELVSIEVRKYDNYVTTTGDEINNLKRSNAPISFRLPNVNTNADIQIPKPTNTIRSDPGTDLQQDVPGDPNFTPVVGRDPDGTLFHKGIPYKVLFIYHGIDEAKRQKLVGLCSKYSITTEFQVATSPQKADDKGVIVFNVAGGSDIEECCASIRAFLDIVSPGKGNLPSIGVSASNADETSKPDYKENSNEIPVIVKDNRLLRVVIPAGY